MQGAIDISNSISESDIDSIGIRSNNSISSTNLKEPKITGIKHFHIAQENFIMILRYDTIRYDYK